MNLLPSGICDHAIPRMIQYFIRKRASIARFAKTVVRSSRRLSGNKKQARNKQTNTPPNMHGGVTFDRQNDGEFSFSFLVERRIHYFMHM